MVDSSDGRIVGVEVLARWRHPEQGLLTPAAFVPMAEELGLIGRIDEAVFEAGCARAAPWVAEGLIDVVSFNVSPRDLMDPSFSRKLIGRLAATSLPAHRAHGRDHRDLSAARPSPVAPPHRAAERQGHKGGAGRLRHRLFEPARAHAPADQTVKLDQSLIADIAKDARVAKLVGSMLHAARALGVRIVAEGVEEEAQAIILRAAGCDRMQGYWFARPMPADEMQVMLRTHVATAPQVEPAELLAPAGERLGRPRPLSSRSRAGGPSRAPRSPTARPAG